MVLVIIQKVLLLGARINILLMLKRSAVIQLTGSSASNEQLTLVSQQGMRSWFRDLFTDAIATQKIRRI